MYDLRIGNNLRGEHPVLVAVSGRHQAVGGIEDRRGEIGKFFLLILPCSTKIALEVRVLFELRIPVGRQHLAVGIDVNPLVLRLLQKLLQIIEVVAGNDDKRAFLYFERDRRGNGRSIGLRVSPVQQLHAAKIDLSHLQHDGQKQIHTPVLADGKECLAEEAVDSVVRVAEDRCVIGVGSHPADAEEDQGFQAADIFIRIPEQFHIIVIVSAAGRRAGRAVGNEALLFRVHLIDQSLNGGFVEVHVGDGREQSFDEQLVGVFRRLRIAVSRTGKANQRADQLILQSGNIRLLAAYSGSSGTSFTTCRLFALKTKHLSVHHPFLLHLNLRYVRPG